MPTHELISKGDVLTVNYYGEGDIVTFKMYDGLQQILKKKNEYKFEGQLTIPQLESGIFSYSILVQKEDSLKKMKEIKYLPTNDEKYFKWIGNKRNVSFTKSVDLLGDLNEITIESKFLGEDRNISIYTPPVITDQTPIFYMTDGSVVKTYAQYVDQLIADNRMSPIIMVGIHCSTNNRFFEYVNFGIEQEIFDNHERFFFEEVMQYVEKNIKNLSGKRYLYGFSNGAAFCIYLGIYYPEKFESVVAFSTVGYISGFVKPIEFQFDDYPEFYIYVGRYEDRAYRTNKGFVKKLREKEINVTFKEFVSGHDYNVWEIEFLEFLLMKFPYEEI
jgi:enterochelin esterase-like enzyme